MSILKEAINHHKNNIFSRERVEVPRRSPRRYQPKCDVEWAGAAATLLVVVVQSCFVGKHGKLIRNPLRYGACPEELSVQPVQRLLVALMARVMD